MWQQIRSNRQKSSILVIIMALILLCTGVALGEIFFYDASWHMGGIAGGVLALLVWFIIALSSYYSGDKFILSTSGAKRVSPDDFPKLYNVVEEMKISSGCTHMPNIYIIPDSSPNAFATGRSPENASVAVTSGLISKLNRDELQGVVAHEISHIMNRDVLLMTMLGTMLGAIVIVSDIFLRARFRGGIGRRLPSGGGGHIMIIVMVVAVLFLVLSPLLAQIIYFATSRKREYLADACAARYTRYPEGLASALEKISAAPQKVQKANRATAPMYIVNPVAALKKSFAGLGGTHPPVKNRIRILRGITGKISLDAYQQQWQEVTGGKQSLFSARDIENPTFAPVGMAAVAHHETAPLPHTGPDVPSSINCSCGKQIGVPAEPVTEKIYCANCGKKHTLPYSKPSKSIDNKSHVNDFFWKKEGYGIIDCECGVRLKLPPDYRYKTIRCPKCRTKHTVNSSGRQKRAV